MSGDYFDWSDIETALDRAGAQVRDKDTGHWLTLPERVAALHAENERLKGSRDSLQKLFDEMYDRNARNFRRAETFQADLEQQSQKMERLCAALGPFARAADGYDAADWAGAWPDDYPIIDSIKVGDYRRARSALQDVAEHNGVADGSSVGRAAYTALKGEAADPENWARETARQYLKNCT